MVTWVVEHELWPKRHRKVVGELQEHLREGHRAIIVTGMYEPLLEALLEKLPGMEAIGTPLAFENGHFTGELAAPFNVGSRKRDQLHPFARDGKILAAYGDTAPDIPMLEMGEHPVAVNPDKVLRQVAEARGWRILIDGWGG